MGSKHGHKKNQNTKGKSVINGRLVVKINLQNLSFAITCNGIPLTRKEDKPFLVDSHRKVVAGSHNLRRKHHGSVAHFQHKGMLVLPVL
jgi:hypothetical protein